MQKVFSPRELFWQSLPLDVLLFLVISLQSVALVVEFSFVDKTVTTVQIAFLCSVNENFYSL